MLQEEQGGRRKIRVDQSNAVARLAPCIESDLEARFKGMGQQKGPHQRLLSVAYICTFDAHLAGMRSTEGARIQMISCECVIPSIIERVSE